MANLLSNAVTGRMLNDLPIRESLTSSSTLAQVLVLAALCALLGIAVMKAVALVESGLSRARCPPILRTALGGALVACLAIVTPAVMGSGHGALHDVLYGAQTLGGLITVLLLKSLASSVSLGSGFRGGLFFASLLIGACAGRAYSGALETFTSFHLDSNAASVAGLAAFGAGVLGAPMTMAVLALEMTGDFYVTVAALVAAATSTLITRELFGYSFATWRFHLRGEPIRGPADIGRIRDLTVGSLMRTDPTIAPMNMTVKEARALLPPGREKQAFLADEQGRVAGILLTGQLYADDVKSDASIASLAQPCEALLIPSMGVRQAIDCFDETETDVLPVVNTKADARIIGFLSEAHALRRYGEELERSHHALVDF